MSSKIKLSKIKHEFYCWLKSEHRHYNIKIDNLDFHFCHFDNWCFYFTNEYENDLDNRLIKDESFFIFKFCGRTYWASLLNLDSCLRNGYEIISIHKLKDE